MERIRLFVPGGPSLEVLTQDGKPFSTDHLVSYVNPKVEVRGEEDENLFRLLEISVAE